MTTVDTAEKLFLDPKGRERDTNFSVYKDSSLSDSRDSVRALRKLVSQNAKRFSREYGPPPIRDSKRGLPGQATGKSGSFHFISRDDSDLMKIGSRLFGSQPALTGNLPKRPLGNTMFSKQSSMLATSLPEGINIESFQDGSRKKRHSQKMSSVDVVLMSDDALLGQTGYQFDDLTVVSETSNDVDEDNEDMESDSEKWENLGKMAEKEVEHNWLLESENTIRMKKFERMKNKLKIRVPEEDPMDSIERRLDEIKQMAKPRRDMRHVLERVPASQRDRIVEIHNMSMDNFMENRRKGWQYLDKFRWAARMVILLLKSFRHRKKYYVDKTDMGHMRRRFETDDSALKPNTRSSIGYELQLCLSVPPDLRTKKQVKKIVWLLRATKAFKHLFPAEMEKEVAKHVAYEKYDDGRIIAFQSRLPDRFYYIVGGRVNMLRQFKLSTGQITKSMGLLSKGMTTDPEELERLWTREDSLVAKGQVEVLLLDREAFMYLQHTTQGPPIDFLRSLDLFEEFPVERFLNNLDAIEYRYYGQGKIVIHDSNRTPWLHVVKSGQVKVIRRQMVIDARASNDGKFNAPTADELGCIRGSSHADAMLGVQAKQKKMKALAQVSLPDIRQTEAGMVTNPFGYTIGIQLTVPDPQLDNDTSTAPMIYRNKKMPPGSKKRQLIIIEDTSADALSAEASTSKARKHDTIDENGNETRANGETEETDEDRWNLSSQKKRRRETVLPPILNIPMKDTEEEFKPHNLWLTREKTEMAYEAIFAKKKQEEKKQRRALVQLDVLNAGDVFGLDHMQPALASEAQGHSLVSDGAEIIKISKRFFLQNADNNTMLKVETMYKEYLSEDEARTVLYDRETWDQYKSALWQRMTTSLPEPTPR